MEDKIIKIENKIGVLENKINKMKDRLYKMTPQYPLVNENIVYNRNTKELDRKYKYSCPYCGEEIRKGIKKHKCGQKINWEGYIQ